MVDRMMRLLMIMAIALWGAQVCAVELPDPTRPPIQLNEAAGDTVLKPALARSTGLQTTIISESRRAAIIDGKTIELGGKLGDARLAEVNEGSVVLQSAKSRRVLTLFPDLKKTQNAIKLTKNTPGNGMQSAIPSASSGAQEEKK